MLLYLLVATFNLCKVGITRTKKSFRTARHLWNSYSPQTKASSYLQTPLHLQADSRSQSKFSWFCFQTFSTFTIPSKGVIPWRSLLQLKNTKHSTSYVPLTTMRNHNLFTWDFKEAEHRQQEFHESIRIPESCHAELLALAVWCWGNIR